MEPFTCELSGNLEKRICLTRKERGDSTVDKSGQDLVWDKKIATRTVRDLKRMAP